MKKSFLITFVTLNYVTCCIQMHLTLKDIIINGTPFSIGYRWQEKKAEVILAAWLGVELAMKKSFCIQSETKFTIFLPTFHMIDRKTNFICFQSKWAILQVNLSPGISEYKFYYS